jgi:hypothetical protein
LNPSILHFSRTGSAVKALFFLGFAATAFFIAGLLYAERDPPPQTIAVPGLDLPAPPPHRDPLTPFKIPFLIVAGGICLFYVGRHGWRAVTRAVAAKIENRHLHLHSSYATAPVPVEAITEAIFDRADRLPGEGSGSAKLGARLRHGLYLRYRVDGRPGELRLIDNDIDGGSEQLRRFAAHLDSWRQSAARTARRD